MNKVQLNFVSMSQAVLTHADSKPEVWNMHPPVVTAVQGLRTAVEGLLQESYNQADKQTSGFTGQKNAAFDQLCEQAYTLMLRIRAYAKKQQDKVLLQKVDFSRSELSRKPESDVINRCQAIHDQGLAYLPQLAEYQVTKKVLSALQTAIHAYKPLAAKRTVISSERTTATANIAGLLDEARTILSEMDDLMAGMVSDTDFVHTYQQTRKIVSRGNKADKKADTENQN